jgi:assimilatory nitrate reductase catalytic subunit
VQEAFATTATCNFADLLLPATTWGEKDGTVTNSERRITRVLPAIPASGEARHDWHIATEVAHRLEAMGIGPQLAAGSMASRFAYETPEAIWLEHRESTRGRDLDITGLSYAQIEQAPQQWPMPEGAEQGLARLYEDGRFPTPSGRARFVAPAYQPVAEALESRFPFALTTGRLRDQWHGMSRTGTLGRLFGHVPEPSVQLNRSDMARRGFAEGDLVHVTSKRGSILVPVQASDEVASSQAFMAMHWGPEFLSGMSTSGQPLAGVNALTPSTYCPISKQPELKHSAVKILKADMPWTLLGLAWLPADRALSARESLSQLMVRFPYASCVPFASASATTSNGEDSPAARTGILFRAASHEPVSDALLVEIEQLLGLDAAGTLRYADRKRGQRRAAHLETRGEQTTLRAVLLAGDTSAETWIRALLQQELPAQSYGRLVLLPGAKPPVAMAERSRQICTCFNVSEDTIEAELPRCRGTESDRLQALQGALKCGTNCGSCIPELQRMLRRVPASLTAA